MWYEGDELTTETAEDVRDKLDKIILSTRQTASNYINDFLGYTKQLEELDESYTASKTTNIFLSQITDPDYSATVESCIESKMYVNDCIERIQGKEGRLGRSKEFIRRPPIHIRRTPQSIQQ